MGELPGKSPQGIFLPEMVKQEEKRKNEREENRHENRRKTRDSQDTCRILTEFGKRKGTKPLA
ncbi:hypothetical protein MSS88_06390 [bacterium]|uniref:hypothetical protein n=1 Tax=Gemmiger sp. TaxID=2049027 RepID=UPI003F05E54B|nr:hypothetical protein [bacterium]MCI7744419.1 hypothetical protein [bacterium]MDD5858319.1 hypothetical protein [bacterium]MDD6718596.1 hypothetical protein [bacterium]